MGGVVQLHVTNIPRGVDHRRVRKCIGHALLQISGEPKPFKIDFNEKPVMLAMEDNGEGIKHILTQGLHPVYCQGYQLEFCIVPYKDAEERKWSQRQVQGIRIEDVESDYESVYSGDDDSGKQLQLRQVSCGVWDSSGYYVDAWRRRCDPDRDCVTVEEDKGRLSIAHRMDLFAFICTTSSTPSPTQTGFTTTLFFERCRRFSSVMDRNTRGHSS